jgi:hypothetical protein
MNDPGRGDGEESSQLGSTDLDWILPRLASGSARTWGVRKTRSRDPEEDGMNAWGGEFAANNELKDQNGTSKKQMPMMSMETTHRYEIASPLSRTMDYCILS